MQMESGDFSDNLEIFLTALYQMKKGAPQEGVQLISDLRRRIVATGEVKSSQWLLPKLDVYLAHHDPERYSECGVPT